MNQFSSAPGQNKKGFAEHLEKDKKIGEEVEIEETLKEIEELMPVYARLTFTIGVSENDNAKDRKALKKEASHFLGHPDRVAWLKSYLEAAKAEMKAAVPEGDLSILKNQKKLKTQYLQESLIIDTAVKIRDGFRKKDWEYMKADAAKKFNMAQGNTEEAGAKEEAKKAEVEAARRDLESKYAKS